MIMGKKRIDEIIDDLSLSHAMKERVEKYKKRRLDSLDSNKNKNDKNTYADIVRGKVGSE